MKSPSSPQDILARVVKSIPVDRTARAVVGTGTHYIPNKNIVQKHFNAPPPTVTVSRGTEDLTGTSFGRFKVVGLLKCTKAHGRLWIVRCSCGDYETRRTRSIKNPNNTEDCCEICRHLLQLKRTQRWKQTGEKVKWSDL